MKYTKIIIILISILIIIGLSTILINRTEDKQKEKNIEKDYKFVMYNIDSIDTTFNNEGYSIIGLSTTEEDYKDTLINYNIDLKNPSKKDFKSYNYLLLVIVYDFCSESLKEKEIIIKDDKATIEYDVQRECGLCAPEYVLYEISLPKNIKKRNNIEVKFNYTDRVNCPTDIAYKPVLYLYPETTTEVTINFENEDNLTTTYPKFKNEWKVIAHPNGDLYDLTNKYYYALYWEEEYISKIDFNKGFYVSKDNAISFLEEKLSIIGLNDKERNEFIMYWLPILEKNKHSLVYFELTDELQNNNELIIDPKPDTLIRIRIHVKKISKRQNIKEQTLSKINRQGYTAVEWGGVTYN